MLERGIFFPTNIMPDFLVVITKALPLTYLNDAFRMITIKETGLGVVWL